MPAPVFSSGLPAFASGVPSFCVETCCTPGPVTFSDCAELKTWIDANIATQIASVTTSGFSRHPDVPGETCDCGASYNAATIIMPFVGYTLFEDPIDSDFSYHQWQWAADPPLPECPSDEPTVYSILGSSVRVRCYYNHAPNKVAYETDMTWDGFGGAPGRRVYNNFGISFSWDDLPQNASYFDSLETPGADTNDGGGQAPFFIFGPCKIDPAQNWIYAFV
jgi:hypothetical protein